MSDKINIDELLKQELGKMAPEPPPGTWESISSQMQLTQPVEPSSQAANTVGSVVKTVSITTKLIVVSAVAVTSAAAFFGYRSLSDQPQPPAMETVVANPALTGEAQGSDLIQQTGSGEKELQPEHDQAQTKRDHIDRKAVAFSGKRSNAKEAITASEEKRAVDQPELNREMTTQPEQGIQAVIPAAIQNTDNGNQASKQADKNENALQEEHVDYIQPVIPNVLTPNNDGLNDEFVITIDNEVLYDLKITDTRGNIVFESRDKNKHWNGLNMSTGKAYEEAVYILAFRYQVKGMKEPAYVTGRVKLITEKQ